MTTNQDKLREAISRIEHEINSYHCVPDERSGHWRDVAELLDAARAHLSTPETTDADKAAALAGLDAIPPGFGTPVTDAMYKFLSEHYQTIRACLLQGVPESLLRHATDADWQYLTNLLVNACRSQDDHQTRFWIEWATRAKDAAAPKHKGG